MTGEIARLIEDREVRDAAHAVFRADLDRVRADLAARGIAGRMADEADAKVREAFGTAIDMAAEHKGVVAGTLAALLLWLFRNPLIDAVGHLFGRDDDEADSGEETDQ